MIPHQTKESIIAGLHKINSMNRVRFVARFRENYVYLDISETMITSNYCRIEYSEKREFLFVQFYNSAQSCFETESVKFKKDILENNLELLLMKHESFER